MSENDGKPPRPTSDRGPRPGSDRGPRPGGGGPRGRSDGPRRDDDRRGGGGQRSYGGGGGGGGGNRSYGGGGGGGNRSYGGGGGGGGGNRSYGGGGGGNRSYGDDRRDDGPRGPRQGPRIGPVVTLDQDEFRFLVTASRGTEPMLRRELKAIGLSGLSEVPSGVTFKGTLSDGMRATLWTRIGMRVLLEIGHGKINGGDDLYDLVRSLALPMWFTADATIAVFAATIDCGFRDDRFASHKTKDAIVDAMRAKYHRRPNVDAKNPDVSVSVRAAAGDAHIYLDMAGGPLSRRGHRVRDVDAPVKENLAAAMLQYSGWDGRRPLHDPTCGGGTIAIEAAGIAVNAAPALGRQLGFERWPRFHQFEGEYTELLDEARQVRKPALRASIVASDIDKEAVKATRNNLAAAGFLDDVVVRKADARETTALRGGGHIVFNPPYGERIGGDDEDIAGLYNDLAARLLGFDDHTVALISTTHALQDGFGGAEPTRAVDVKNGKLRCRMLVYEQ